MSLMEKIKYHKRNKIRTTIFYIADITERNLNAEFNCVHGAITGIIMALMFIGALFV